MMTSNKLRCVVLAASVLCCGAGPSARADLTLNGMTGLTINPTAETLAPGSVRGQVGYYVLGTDFGGEFSYYGAHAATRLKNMPLELGVGVTRLDATEEDFPGSTGDLERTGVDLGAKYVLQGDREPEALKLAVGAGYSRALFQNRHLYVVASKPVKNFLKGRPAITTHLGVRHDRYRSNDETSNRASVYGGLTIPIDRNGTYTFAGELQSKNHHFNVPERRTDLLYSYALRYSPGHKKYSASIGIERQGLLSDSSLFGYFGYNF